MKEYPIEFHKLSDKVECTWCGFNGKIRLYKQAGGLIYENKNRYNIFGFVWSKYTRNLHSKRKIIKLTKNN